MSDHGDDDGLLLHDPIQEPKQRRNSEAESEHNVEFEKVSPWSSWKFKHQEGIERAERWFYYFMSTLVFLVITASLGTAVYVGALLIGPIAAGLAAALPLGIPAVALTIIGAGILIASVAALLRFVQIHWEMHQFLKLDEDGNEQTDYTYKDTLKAMAKTPLRYAFVLFTAAFVMGVSTQAAIKMYDENYTMAAKLKHLVWPNKYHAAAIVAALGLGIALAVPVVPYVMATVIASFGLPYGVAVLFGAVAAATIIAITYQLLASLTTLKRLYDLARGAYHHGALRMDAFYYFYTAAAVIGVAVAVAAAYLFFVPLVNVLTPVLVSSSLATFLAIATSVSLALALMNFVPAVVVGGPAFMKTKFYEDSKLQEWWNADARVWADWGKRKRADESIELHPSSDRRSSTTLLPQPVELVESDNRWFFQKENWGLWKSAPKSDARRNDGEQPSSSGVPRSATLMKGDGEEIH